MNNNVDVHKEFASYFQGNEGLAYALSKKLGDGHICVDVELYKTELAQLETRDNVFLVEPQRFDEQCQAGRFVTHDASEFVPFVVEGGKAYLQRYHYYETSIAENIKRLVNRRNFKIVTGGPGTGKTYGVSKELVALFEENPTLKVALTAPTGKAAVRVNESIRNFATNENNNLSIEIKELLTNLQATTLHRLLGYQKDSVFFRHNEKNRLPYDVVIVDECSMIDGAMMAKLLMAIGDNTKLYLLGDKDQLASVDAGSVFGDMCNAQHSPVLKDNIEIKKQSFRFNEEKGIGKFSKEILSGEYNPAWISKNDKQLRIDCTYDEGIFEKRALEYVSYIQELDIKKALQLLNQIRFLCVTRENDFSVSDTNRRIEKILKKRINDNLLFNPREGFYHNQPVIITKNDYSLGVFNGDVGIIRRENDVLTAYFETTDGSIKTIPAGYLNECETVFAMTIHKSQGSEFEHVVILLPPNEKVKLLTRELLYTGVTRAKSFALIQSSEATLRTCVENEVTRASGLKERLNNLTL